MKIHAWLVALTLVAGAAQAEGEAEAAAVPEIAGEVAAEEAAPLLPIPAIGSGPNGPFSYAMGFSLGQRIAADIKELDVSAFQEGFQEAYTGVAGKLSQEQMQQVVDEFRTRYAAAQQAEFEKLAAANLAAGNEFLKKNGKKRGVKTTASGLQYKVINKGKGASPQPTDLVTAHYHGTLVDGSVFDSSRDGDPAQFPLDRVIPGWKEGVQLMKKGAKYQFWIPPALAYGEQGVPEANIGPNQVLSFEVELIDFGPAPAAVPTGE